MAEDSEKIPTDILGLLDNYGISYPKNMEHPQISCLLGKHSDSTPSMTFYPETNSFFCFGCEESGTPETLVMHMEKCSYPQAVKLLYGEGFEWSKLRKKAEKSVDIDMSYGYEVLAKKLKEKVHSSVDNKEKLDKLRGLILKYVKEEVGPNQLFSCLKEIKGI